MTIVEKLHKANVEEQTAKKALNNYRSSLETTYGSLTNIVQEIIQRHNILNELAMLEP